MPKTIYDFTPNNIEGKATALDQYKGNILLIVNTASECGFTPQYEGLQALYEKYNDEGLEILGFPANNFGGQEPDSDQEIKQFCTTNYSVTFPMFSKVDVKGKSQYPLFSYLTSADNPDFTGKIKWNFEKFLLSSKGTLLRRFRSKVDPDGKAITNAVEKALSN